MILTGTAELAGTTYRPRTKETTAAWEYLLSFVAGRTGGEERDVLAAAAEECLRIMKNDDEGDLGKKGNVEAVLGHLDADTYAQLVNLTRRITDYTPALGAATMKTEEDDEAGVAVVFEEEDDDEEDRQYLSGIVDEEDEAELDASIPVIKMEAGFTLPEEDEQGTFELPTMIQDEQEGESLNVIDLDSLAFAQGTILLG